VIRGEKSSLSLGSIAPLASFALNFILSSLQKYFLSYLCKFVAKTLVVILLHRQDSA
jgi:hypothetical protein